MKTNAHHSAAILLATAMNTASAQDLPPPAQPPKLPPASDSVLQPPEPLAPTPPSRVAEYPRNTPAAMGGAGSASGSIPRGAPTPGSPGGSLPERAEAPGGHGNAIAGIPGDDHSASQLPGSDGYGFTPPALKVHPRAVPTATMRTGQDIIRETKLKVLQRHYEMSFNESIETEKAALTATPEERQALGAKAMALKEFAAKLEGEIRELTVPASAVKINSGVSFDPFGTRPNPNIEGMISEPARPGPGAGGGLPGATPVGPEPHGDVLILR